MLLLAAWATSGLWPWHRQEPAALTAPVAALLMARVAIPAVPDGLEHWRALAFPVVLLGLCHGALTRRRAESIVALAWVGLVTATPMRPGRRRAPAAGWSGARARRAAAGSRRSGRSEALRVGAALVLGTGALARDRGRSRDEVVYSVLAAAALVAGAGVAAVGSGQHGERAERDRAERLIAVDGHPRARGVALETLREQPPGGIVGHA